MPFVVPNIPWADGSRSGVTAINGSLTPSQSGSVSRVGANIIATIPGGLITATCSWGFMAGPAPRGTTTLTVAASGTTFERAHSATAGGYASATAEIWTTVEQFVLIHERLERRSLPRLEFERSFSSAPTPIFNLTNWVLGYQIAHIRNATAATVLVMPITPLRYYRWWISSGQSAGCSGGFGGLGGAVSNFAFDMNPVFFSFT